MKFAKSISIKLELTADEVEALRIVVEAGHEELGKLIPKINPLDNNDWVFIEDLIQVLN